MEAEAGDVDPDALACLQDARAVLDEDLVAVDGNLRARTQPAERAKRGGAATSPPLTSIVEAPDRASMGNSSRL